MSHHSGDDNRADNADDVGQGVFLVGGFAIFVGGNARGSDPRFGKNTVPDGTKDPSGQTGNDHGEEAHVMSLVGNGNVYGRYLAGESAFARASPSSQPYRRRCAILLK